LINATGAAFTISVAGDRAPTSDWNLHRLEIVAGDRRAGNQRPALDRHDRVTLDRESRGSFTVRDRQSIDHAHRRDTWQPVETRHQSADETLNGLLVLVSRWRKTNVKLHHLRWLESRFDV
jgi:hypothetical protein